MLRSFTNKRSSHFIQVQYLQDWSERGDDEDAYDLTEQKFNTIFKDRDLFVLHF
jgi:hypothetical protein